MNKSGILLGAALIGFSCITFSDSLKCFSCHNKKSCKKPTSIECSAKEANATRTYLDLYHRNVPMNTTSPSLECFRENIQTKTIDSYYMGCTYTNIAGCNLPLRDIILSTQHTRNCYQCNNKNGCNPAGRANINLSTVFASTILVALIAKCVQGN